MNRLHRLALTLGTLSLFAAGSQANAQPSCNGEPTVGATEVEPGIRVCVNGVGYDFRMSVDGKLSYLSEAKVDLGGGAMFTISAMYDADPFTAFSFGSIVPGGFGPINFDIYFTTPVIGGPYNYATSTLNGTLSALIPVGAAGGTGSIGSGSYPYYLSGTADATNLGVDFGNTPCSVSTNASVSCASGGTFNSFAAFSPSSLTARLSYSHSHTGVGTSTAAWQGRVDLLSTTVPEPSTVVLMTVGLFVVGVTARRKIGAAPQAE